jgi:adenosylcobinamide kinase/adenosylcobinamide-phosphate guanylyltransferase
VTFIATAQALDDEMSARIEKHRTERPAGWATLEIPFGIASHLDQIKSDVVVLDCLTLLVTNVLMQFVRDDIADETASTRAVNEEIGALLKAIRDQNKEWIITSNEVGQGLIPPYQMGRLFRDLLGWANQRLAREADEVYWMVAGIPVPIQGYKTG